MALPHRISDCVSCCASQAACDLPLLLALVFPASTGLVRFLTFGRHPVRPIGTFLVSPLFPGLPCGRA